MELDLNLIAHARRFVDGSNVHYVNTWIFCYQLSQPESPRRRRYEALLRDFVSSRELLKVTRRRVESARVHCAELHRTAASINARIQKLLTLTSD
jgi:hypothetical protein